MRVNLVVLKDTTFVEDVERRLNALLEGTPTLKEEILTVAGRRMVGE